MHRLTQNTSNAYARRGGQARRSVNVVEYGLLAMLVISLVSIGATLAGSKLKGAFSTVAVAMEESGRASEHSLVRPENKSQRRACRA